MRYELHDTLISAITKLFALANNTRLRVCENKRSSGKDFKELETRLEDGIDRKK